MQLSVFVGHRHKHFNAYHFINITELCVCVCICVWTYFKQQAETVNYETKLQSYLAP